MKWWQKILKVVSILGLLFIVGFLIFQSVFKRDSKEAQKQYRRLIREIRNKIAEVTQSETVVESNVEHAEEEIETLEQEAERIEQRIEQTQPSGSINHHDVVDAFQDKYRNTNA